MFYFHLNVTLHTAMKLKFYEYLLFIFHIQQQQKIYLYIHIYAKLKYEDLTRSFSLNRQGLPEARKKTPLKLTLVLFTKFLFHCMH